MFEQVIEKIKEYDRIIIHRHFRPDGDAIGSAAGLKWIIKNNWPEKEVYCVGDSPSRYGFIEGSEIDSLEDEAFSSALCFVLDCGSSQLVSDTRYEKASYTIRIDHHLPCTSFCSLEILDPGFESCASMIGLLAIENNLSLSKEAAQALYTGLVTDSGRFLYDSTTTRTFNIASALIATGIDLNHIYQNLYSENLQTLRLRAQYFLKTEFTAHNVAYNYTTEQELNDYGVDAFTISRGMVNTMANIKGTSIWVNFTESQGKVLCEIRSNSKSINAVAVKHGGGGHAKASGASLLDRNEAMEVLRELDDLEAGND